MLQIDGNISPDENLNFPGHGSSLAVLLSGSIICLFKSKNKLKINKYVSVLSYLG